MAIIGKKPANSEVYYTDPLTIDKSKIIYVRFDGINPAVTNYPVYFSTDDVFRNKVITGIDVWRVGKTPLQIQTDLGYVGTNLASLRKLAADYNVALSDADVRKFAVSGLTDKNALEATKLKIQNTAKVRYQNLGQYIDQGLTVRDIASQYINKMANVLEVNPDTIKLDDRYIETALSTLPNFNDFNKMLRNSPQWEYTTNAREEAAGYANKILQDFGLR